MSCEPIFWHEKLDVYRQSLRFFSEADDLVRGLSRRVSAADHLERAMESILENIVSGNASWSKKMRRQCFAVAYGSALECAACLDVLHAKGALELSLCQARKQKVRKIVQMLVGLIRTSKGSVILLINWR